MVASPLDGPAKGRCIGIQIDPVRHKDMREVTAYFLVYQGKDALPGVGEEAADQRGRRDGNRPMLVMPVVVAALLDHTLAVFVVGKVQIDGPVQLVLQSGAQTDGKALKALSLSNQDQKPVFLILVRFVFQVLFQG